MDTNEAAGVIVHFSDPGEFVEELARDPHAVARKIVRVTQKARPTQLGLTAVSVIATAKVLSEALGTGGTTEYDIVRLERHVGELWGHGGRDEEVHRQSGELVDEIVALLTAAECGFVLAAGEYDAANALGRSHQ